MPNLGPFELIIILVIVIVIFGAGKLGDVGSALGKGIKEFKKASKDVDEVKEEFQSVADDVKAGATKQLDDAKSQVEQATEEVSAALTLEGDGETESSGE